MDMDMDMVTDMVTGMDMVMDTGTGTVMVTDIIRMMKKWKNNRSGKEYFLNHNDQILKREDKEHLLNQRANEYYRQV